MPRTAGAKNKDRGRAIRAIRNALGEEFEPMTRYMELAVQARNDGDVRLEADLLEKVLPYCYPKLRQVEVDVTVDNPREGWTREDFHNALRARGIDPDALTAQIRNPAPPLQ